MVKKEKPPYKVRCNYCKKMFSTTYQCIHCQIAFCPKHWKLHAQKNIPTVKNGTWLFIGHK